ncbi:MAG: class I SAM-dependent methyltransferase [Flavobacteriales bacterium]
MAQEMQEGVWKTDSNWFKHWFNSEAYHVLYGHRSDAEADNLVRNLVQSGVLGETGKVLDAGCAFDLSTDSIFKAKKHGSRPSPHYQVLDLRHLHEVAEWEGSFDLVTNFFTSLGYFESETDQSAVVQGLGQVLRPGGKLLIDYLNVSQVRESLVPYEVAQRQGTDFFIHRRIHGGWIEKSIQYAWNGVDCQHVERVQSLERADFERLLRVCNLQIVEAFGDYQLNPWTAKSPRLMLLAEKI